MSRGKFSWGTRLRICWCVLRSGNCDLKKYKTVHEQEQWDLCEKMRRELQSAVRPRSQREESEFMDQ